MTAVVSAARFTALAMVLGAPFAALYGWLGPGIGLLALVGYMFSPLAAAAILARREGVGFREGVGLHPRRTWAWLGATAIPLGVGLAAIPASLVFPGVVLSTDFSGLLDQLPADQAELAREQLAALPSPWVLLPLMLVQAAVAGATINALAAFGEEAGWRGWLHRELRPTGFWTRSLIVGVFWGLWHAPLILQGYNHPEHPLVGVAMMVALCVGLSPPMTWLRERTGSSLGPAVFHGTFNAIAALPVLYLSGGSDLTLGTLGFGGLGVLALVSLGLWASGAAELEPG